MVNVLVTTAFDEARLDRLRRISPDLTVTRAEADTADYSRAEILYAGALPHDPGRAPGLKWVQVHMAGVNGLYEHPIYANAAIALTTASGVHITTTSDCASKSRSWSGENHPSGNAPSGSPVPAGQ